MKYVSNLKGVFGMRDLGCLQLPFILRDYYCLSTGVTNIVSNQKYD